MSRFGYVMVTYLVTMSVAIVSFIPTPTKLIWNASASVRTGLYSVHPARDLQLGDLVIVAPPAPLADMLADRGALPLGVPLIKPVAGLPGQMLCRNGAAVSVDGVALGEARTHDRAGRPLPVWQGCRVIGADEIFLMNPAEPDSFDGRYFGALPATAVIGRASPLWVSERP